MAERIALRVEDGGQRVDRFLAAHSLLSRSAIARLAREGHVRVDGAAVEPSYKVRIAAWRSGAERQALLHVTPITGRTHQIRAHLAFARIPIVGDPVYGKRGDRSGLERQFLHAWRLTVRLPHAGERTFTAPLAPDLVA